MTKVEIPRETEDLASAVVHAAYEVHRSLGPGLLEAAYQECMAIELAHAGVPLSREQTLSLNYRGQVVPNVYRADLIVGERLLVELKAIEAVHAIHRVQVTTYLRILRLPLGLLINFNVPLIKDGITRVLNLDFRGEGQTGVVTPPSASGAKRPFASSRLCA
jgi:GxxExxY protein